MITRMTEMTNKMKRNNLEFKITQEDNGKTIEQLLLDWMIPRKERYLLGQEKRFLVNGNFRDFREPVFQDELVQISWLEAEDKLDFANSEFCDVLYEDDNLIIVNKPEGMKSHANQNSEIALQNHVAAYCGQDVYVVHRLDQETSGCILFAKNSFVLPILDQLLEQKLIFREYLALVSGEIIKSDFIINDPIGRDRHDSKKQIVSPKGKKAITHVKLLQANKKASLVSCQLETGRTHQIRVHLSHLGHPIIGDQVYGKKVNSAQGRMMLHAYKMSLQLPFHQGKISISAPGQSFDQGC